MKLTCTFITLTAVCTLWAQPKAPGTTALSTAPVFYTGPEDDVEGVGLLRKIEGIQPESLGAFATTADGTRVLVLRIANVDAPAARLYVRNMALPPSARLFVYGINASGTVSTMAEPYEGVGPLESGDFWTHPVQGSEVVVELQASEVLPDLPFELVGLAPSEISEVPAGAPDNNEEIRTSIFRGMALTHAVKNGKAIFEGDIELGNADELPHAEWTSKNNSREAVAITGSSYRWPKGIIPYRIDPTMPSQARVTDAIAHWNTKLQGHIQWVPKTTEKAAVYFMRSTSASSCSSAVGRTGYEQVISLGDSCAKGNVIHEMGHAIGLWHEQTREDRNIYVKVMMENVKSGLSYNFTQNINNADDIGVYDYGSIMHYPANSFSANGLPTIQTIPAGIPIGQRTALSAGDVAAVKAMYPAPTDPPPPPTVTVESIPTAMPVVVDGVSYKTPKTFQWTPGSAHNIVAVNPPIVNGTRNAFVRWTDGGAQTHTVIAPTASMVYRADYATSYSAVVGAGTPGSVTAAPLSSDTFYPKGTSVQLEAVAPSGSCFTSWTGLVAGTPAKTKLSMQKAYTVQANFQGGGISVAPSTLTVPITASTQQLSVSSTSGCVWTAASPVTWIKITAGASGNGPATVTLSISSRSATSAARSATLTVGGQPVVITQ